MHPILDRLDTLATSAYTTASNISMPAIEMPDLIFNRIGLWLFLAFFVFRYFRTVVSIFTFNLYKAKPVPESPSYTSYDVSVIIPTTFKTPDELVRCVRRILLCDPRKIFIVTAEANVNLVRDLCALNSFALSKIQVLGVDKLNKRTQILRAMPHVESNITVLADDDVFWPNNYLTYLLAIFEDPKVGAGGTRQRVQRDPQPSIWNFLGISYLERRVWNNCATNAIDGGISTLSGRTAAYRSEILKDPEFEYYFTHDFWRGRPLNSDDDKCLTRYVYSHGWNIALQFDERSIIETTLEGDWQYLSQAMRWSRAHWRGNFTVMENERYWCSFRFLWTFYYIYLGQFQTPALLVDGLMVGLLSFAIQDSPLSAKRTAYGILAAWIFFTKIVKLIPHFKRHPSDMKFIPVSILFSYFHGFLNIYALLTMSQTQWGSQNLETLAEKRAEKDEVVPLLKETMDKADGFRKPTPGKSFAGFDYFSLKILGRN